MTRHLHAVPDLPTTPPVAPPAAGLLDRLIEQTGGPGYTDRDVADLMRMHLSPAELAQTSVPRLALVKP